MAKRQTNERITLASNVDWAVRALRCKPEDVIIASPYLTKPTALKVIRHSSPSTTVVLTKFEVELFTSGASSLSVFKQLILEGYTLYQLKDVHAKLIVTPTVILVGSQNLTAAGTRSREATGRVTDLKEVLRVREELETWVADAVKISPEMMIDMEHTVAALQPKMKLIFDACRTADEEIEKAEQSRIAKRRIETEAAERRKLERKRRREAKKLGELQNAIRNAVVIGQHNVLLVKCHSQAKIRPPKPYWTLKANQGVLVASQVVRCM